MPITITEAKVYVAKHHRHNLPPVGALFAVAVENVEGICGVAIVGRPIARMLQDGYTCEILRVCTDGSRNANSMLYGACRRAAISLGYRRGITYTLERESGSSLRGSGWTKVSIVPGGTTWERKNRHTTLQRDIFGNDRRPVESKVRWEWTLKTAEIALATLEEQR